MHYPSYATHPAPRWGRPPLINRCDDLKSTAPPPRHMASDGLELPTPHAGRNSSSEDRRTKKAAQRDSHRLFWVDKNNSTPARALRLALGPLILMLVIAQMVFSDRLSALHTGIATIGSVFVILSPAVLSTLFSKQTGNDRLKIKDGDPRSLASFPGSERILGTLKDNHTLESLRFMAALSSGFLLLSSNWFYAGTIPHTVVLIGATLLCAFVIALTVRLEKTIQMTSKHAPLLTYHVPTLHESQLPSILSDLVLAHLDPESASAWEDWLNDLAPGVRGEMAPAAARERILQIVHLHHEGLLDELRMKAELRRVVRRDTMEELLDDSGGTRFNIVSLTALLEHTRKWQPGIFRILHRLRNGVLSGEGPLTTPGWRMDHDLPLTCSECRGDLFVMLHNLTEETETVELEVVVPEGQPEKQTFRITPMPARPMDGPTPKTSLMGQDLVDGMGALLRRALVLWIGIAWTSNTTGPHPVQITLRKPGGATIDSVNIRTDVWTGSGGSDSTQGRMKRAGAQGFDDAVRVLRGSFSLR